MRARGESPLFLKVFEMLEWLLKHTRKFPKDQRFVMAKRLEDAALGLYDELLRAASNGAVQPSLREADFHLARLKAYNRLSERLGLHTMKQYEFLAGLLDEIGKLLGGWIRSGGRS